MEIKKKNINIVIALLTFIFIFSVSGCKQATLGQTKENDISKLIDKKLEAIVSNPDHALSSNPYDYIKNNNDYKYIINQGEKALDYMLIKFKDSKENGLKEYIMAIACSEILGEKVEQKTWSTGREWYEQYTKNKQPKVNIKGTLIDAYCVALDSFMPLDEGLNSSMKFISIDGNTLEYLHESNRRDILKYFEKYNVRVLDASYEELKRMGLFNEKQLILDGILLSVNNISILSDENIIIEGSKYRSGDGAIGVTCNLKYKDRKWKVDKVDIKWIS